MVATLKPFVWPPSLDLVFPRETVARIDITLPSLINRLANQSGVTPLAGEPREDRGQTLHDDLSQRAVRLLLRIDGALARMASR
jgi:hypothetical protein